MKPHIVEWTEEKVGAFWRVNHTNFSRRRYSQQVGPALARLVGKHVASGGVILDYGCGNGDLLRVLDATRYKLLGTDYEMPPDFVLFSPGTGGSPSPTRNLRFVLPSQMDELNGTLDAVLLIEVVEHLEDPVLDGVLSRIRSLLKPEGRVLVTTPNREDLPYNTVNCPDCGCIFHRVQHVRSWSAATLAERMALFGLVPLSLMETDLGRMQRSPLSRLIRTALDRYDRRKEPHLVGIFKTSA
jgi:SAM-dependent methyltransferase